MLLLQIWHPSGLHTLSPTGGTAPQRTAGYEMRTSPNNMENVTKCSFNFWSEENTKPTKALIYQIYKREILI